MKRKRAFTLLEMSIALAVSAIALAILSMIFVSINSFSNNKTEQNQIQIELLGFKTSLCNAFEKYQSIDFAMSVNQSSISFEKQEQTFVIQFKDGTLQENSSTIFSCSKIENAEFDLKDNFVKCTLSYGENQSYEIILNKRI